MTTPSKLSSSEASDAPHFTTLAERRCCADHLEEQLDPLRTAGKTFALAHTPSRTTAVTEAGAATAIVPEPDFVRFVSASAGAVVKTTLPPPDGKEPEVPLVANVHFEDRIESGTMVFDYRMRPGVVERSNALELMRAIGLEI